MKSARPAIVSTALAAALLTGCSAAAPPGTSQPASPSAGSKAPAAAASGSAAGGQQNAGVGVASSDTSQVLAEQDYTLPGTQDSVKIGVQSLVVDGKTMILKMVLTPDVTSASDNEAISIYDMTGGGSSYIDPKLVDRENLKEYSLISDHADQWSTDIVTTDATNGQPVIWWGVYAAPEDDITSVDLRVMPGVPEFTNVPIQR